MDCHHFRDHSRGLRPGPAAQPARRRLRLRLGLGAHVVRGDLRAPRPEGARDSAVGRPDQLRPLHQGRRAGAGRRTATARSSSGSPTAGRAGSRCSLRDEHGRELHAGVPGAELPQVAQPLAHAVVPGELGRSTARTGWGENQDWFDIEVIRAHQRRRWAHSHRDQPDDLTAEWFTVHSAGGVHRDRRASRADGHRRDVPHGPCRARRRTPRRGPDSVMVKFPTADAGHPGPRPGDADVRARGALLPRPPAAPRRHQRPRHATSPTLDEDTGNFTLVLEDLSARTRPGDVLTREQPGGVRGGARRTGRPAGRVVELVRRRAGCRGSPTPRGPSRSSTRCPPGCEPFLARFGHALEPEQVALFER